MGVQLFQIIDKNFSYFDQKIILNTEFNVLNNNYINGSKKTEIFFDSLKDHIVKNVHLISNSIYEIQKSLVTLTEFYCNPYNEYLRIKNDLIPGINFNGEICIVGVWFSKKSYGPYIVLNNINQNDHNLFIDNDSDEEIESIIKDLKNDSLK